MQRATRAEEAVLPEITPERVALCVWRARERVYHRPLERAEAEALAAVKVGTTFGALCEQAALAAGDVEAPAIAAGWLARWIEDRLLLPTSPR